jgi:hypothetical protein
MKNWILMFLLIASLNVFSQKDSTEIEFEYLENDELILSNELNDIQMLTFKCSDTSMLNKRFFITIEEFEKGKLREKANFSLTCEEQRIPMIVGSDTMIYVMNSCDHIEFDNPEESFKIKFAGKFKSDDSLKLFIKYPSIRFTTKLKGKENYSLREIILKENGKAKISTLTKVPIMAYTPPFDAGQINNYCILEDAMPEKWYEKFKIQHFYIFYLNIE